MPSFTQDTPSPLLSSIQSELAAKQQRMYSELQHQATATQQRMFSKLQTTLLSNLVSKDALAQTDANIQELQASVKTLTERDSKHSSTIENMDSNLVHVTKDVLPILSTNLATLQADYYGWFLTSRPLQDSPAMDDEPPMGQLDSRLADLHRLLDS